MATATARATTTAAVPSRERWLTIAPALAIAAFASMGAGAIHAAAIGVHSEHRQAVVAFAVVAAVQIGWGALALVWPGRGFALAGIVINAAILVGWLLGKTGGVSFVDGLATIEDVRFADLLAAALVVVALGGALVAAFRGVRPAGIGSAALVSCALVTALVAVPAMVAAGGHVPAADTADAAAASGAGGNADMSTKMSGNMASTPPKPYDPTKPIDLGGVPGVTPEQQARAENLIAVTLLRLPKYSDPAVAEAAGFRSIGDAATGDEHYINTAYFDDGRILDPDYPESLVYQPDGKGGKKLAAAMYMLPPGSTLDDVPDIGGKLTQWHIHGNLCFTAQGRVGGLTNEEGTCPAPLVKGSEAPMIHVWIQPHKCGPFAALEGVGAGQIAPGEERLCDQVHGS